MHGAWQWGCQGCARHGLSRALQQPPGSDIWVPPIFGPAGRLWEKSAPPLGSLPGAWPGILSTEGTTVAYHSRHEGPLLTSCHTGEVRRERSPGWRSAQADGGVPQILFPSEGMGKFWYPEDVN